MGEQLPLPIPFVPPKLRVEHPHIIWREDGVPCIEGTRVPAQRIYSWHKRGTPMDVLFKRYPLIPRAFVLSAAAFCYDNPDVLQEDFA